MNRGYEPLLSGTMVLLAFALGCGPRAADDRANHPAPDPPTAAAPPHEVPPAYAPPEDVTPLTGGHPAASITENPSPGGGDSPSVTAPPLEPPPLEPPPLEPPHFQPLRVGSLPPADADPLELQPWSLDPPPDGARIGTPEDPPQSLPRDESSPVAQPLTAPAYPLAEHADPENYTVVRVFYGTDRAGLDELQRARSRWGLWLRMAGVALAGFVVGAALLLVGRRGWLVKALTVAAFLATMGFAAAAAMTGAAQVPRALQPQQVYGTQRGQLKRGYSDVSIPRQHRLGRLESPSVLRLEFRADPEKHVVLLETQELPAERFFADLAACVARSQRRQALVFIHGYNVTFEDAMRRTAQLAYDLSFDGAPICYSWPSQGTYIGYTVDETNVQWTEPHLEQFLDEVRRHSGAERIHLIAHSMGNRALTAVLRTMAAKMQDERPLFAEVVLTAPDIDADVFRRDLAPAITRTAERVTLYASSTDEALAISKRVHGYPRAGETGAYLVVLPGVETIDVTHVDTSLLGHSYYGDNHSVLSDLVQVVNAAQPPEQRYWLKPRPLGDLRYWVLLRERLAVASRPEVEPLRTARREEEAPPPQLGSDLPATSAHPADAPAPSATASRPTAGREASDADAVPAATPLAPRETSPVQTPGVRPNPIRDPVWTAEPPGNPLRRR